MQQHTFGPLPPVSTLTLGGGGLGMLWGKTTVEECVATVQAAVAAGITLLDLAPRYGDGKAELVVGEAFGGRLPAGIRVTSKCNLGNAPPERIEALLRRSCGSTCSSCIPISSRTRASSPAQGPRPPSG
jgi:aryl-alcohol dehydrogenase-like predicted oxidoreductase